MLNILFHYSSQQIHTGSPRVLIKLIEGLDRSQCKPYFLANKRGDLFEVLKINNVEILSGSTNSVSKSRIIKCLINIIRLVRIILRNNIDIIHVNELGWNSELVFAAWLCRKPIFFHIHNQELFSNNNFNCRLGSKYFFVSS